MASPGGPLTGLKVVEFAGLGPAPFCGMLLSDLGADVLRIDRKGARPYVSTSVTTRGRRSVAVDLKHPGAAALCLRLIEQADILIEGFRPGVMERLGLGPDVALARKPSLVYGRMTGWGQDGPNAKQPGHDINYIALSGALHAIGTQAEPVIPINLVGDFGGGSLYLAFGIMAALHHARATGQGQVVDAAMVDGASSLLGMIYGYHASGYWKDERQVNSIDGGSHYYNVYPCKDGEWIALGATEPQFYANLLGKLGLGGPEFHPHRDRTKWPALKKRFAETIRGKTRAEWLAIMDGSECCVTPVLSLAEAPRHPHNVARSTFVEIDGVVQPGPAPRFSQTPGAVRHAPVSIGADNLSGLVAWGFDAKEVERLTRDGAVQDCSGDAAP
ncbi:CaiB/BaiF CoA transferase family protein [Caenimonas aquaedulcis]|uniref:CoA transferase n=1 Tax=Caenimonas aquaedulcis TaxID=2793270 RepID=A0A931MIS4_9BURK|nr:CaiB/BaiF CoA-transferase family protein [Caenimonas aquaedulcis]MBG9390451.1 CoA transferase [Caenimonas aquaedulcis]